ncbi:MAG: putative 4-hydroxybenzoate polyprenyltransferase [Acidobacteriia bacterium]|nr:putative 4-hydroxybenzoate polyprenyltransferase [Terriglobia bacterium]
MAFFKDLKTTLDMIRFEHSVFALPFALIGALLAAQGIPSGRVLVWIIVAMVAARSAAMTFNRIVDRAFDAANPRTRMRPLQTGRLTVRFAWIFTIVSSAVFLFAAERLNSLAFLLSPFVLLILLAYSWTKRFTDWSHLVLGFCLGMAPVGAWIAVRGSVDWRPFLLCAAVTLWTAGFDIIYACQDIDYDRSTSLHSIPKSFGIRAALIVSSVLHLVMVGLLVALAVIFQLSWFTLIGIGIIAGLLIYEHALVKPNDLSRVNAAFFTVNGFIGILFLIAVSADVLWWLKR